MKKAKNDKRRLRIHLIFVYSLMVVTVVILATIMMFIVEGYRYNQYNGKIEQGGLVQFKTKPSGAAVTVDGTRLTARTSSKLTLSAGQHDITMAKDGHSSWKKTVTVKPGGILWLDYAQLFPSSITSTTAATFTGVASALPSTNHRWMAVVTDATKPDISLVSLDTDTPETTHVSLEPEKYTAGTTHDFSIVAWDNDSRRILVKHVYDSKTEYLSLDTNNGSTYNITALLGANIQKIWYSLGDNDTVYMVTADNELRRGDLSEATLSGPLAKNISDATMTERNLVVYTTLPDSDGVRTVGYVSSGKIVAKTIATYTDALEGVLTVSSGNYYNKHYIAIIHGNNVSVLRGDLPSSDSKLPLQLETVVSQTISHGENTVGFSPGENRIVYAVNDNHLLTYDLELATANEITLDGGISEVLQQQVTSTPGVQWFDRMHVMTSAGSLRVSDFDGTNEQTLITSVANQPAVLSRGEKYVYYFTADDEATLLKRVQIVD